MNPAISPQAVAGYLYENPDFLLNHPQVLANLRLPIQAKTGVVSLVERQIEALRQQNAKLQKHLDALLDYGHANDTIQAQLNTLTMTLWAAQASTQAELFDLAQRTLSDLFDKLHFVIVSGALLDEKEAQELPPILCTPDLPLALQAVCGVEGSHALVRIIPKQSPNETRAVLICSSENKNHFHPDMGLYHLERVQAVLNLACDLVMDSGA